MQSKQNIGALEAQVEAITDIDSAKVFLRHLIKVFTREMQYTQDNVVSREDVTKRQGELEVRKSGRVRVAVSPAMESADYKIDTTLFVHRDGTKELVISGSTPDYNSRKRDEFYVDCDEPGTLKWHIDIF